MRKVHGHAFSNYAPLGFLTSSPYSSYYCRHCRCACKLALWGMTSCVCNASDLHATWQERRGMHRPRQPCRMSNHSSPAKLNTIVLLPHLKVQTAEQHHHVLLQDDQIQSWKGHRHAVQLRKPSIVGACCEAFIHPNRARIERMLQPRHVFLE